jgi:chromosome segregation ATPase
MSKSNREATGTGPTTADVEMAKKHGWRYWFDNYQEMLNQRTEGIKAEEKLEPRITELEARLLEATGQRLKLCEALETCVAQRDEAAAQLAEANTQTQSALNQFHHCRQREDKWQARAEAAEAQLAEANRKLNAAKAQWRAQFEQRQFLGDLIDNMPMNLLLADLQAAEARAEAMRAALSTIAEWPFDIRGDCVADARKLAQAALAPKTKEESNV